MAVGGAIAAVAAAFWAGVLVGLDSAPAVRDSAAVAMWATAALAAGLLGGIPYVRWSAAREADRIRAGAAR
ncbi:hypothetical protein [Streptomyces sp. NPDC059708]|uniref:hypothetical protein n=1 Tax=Streptomyces sp. NPDC059708 TaxID=3346916 RepID=UPI0036A6356A